MNKSFLKMGSLILAACLTFGFACILAACNNVYTVPSENCIIAVSRYLELKPIDDENDCIYIESDIKLSLINI